MKIPANGAVALSSSVDPQEDVAVEKKTINQELWQACAGPLVNLPIAGTHVVYFPQGHSEQVAASMKKVADGPIPNYPNLPSKLLCLLHNVTLHADPETDEVYAQMTLQPVSSFDKEALLRSDLSLRTNKPQPEFFCKTLTASDTSTHGGFSVPRRAAEKIFPPLDFSMQPPAQELVARDLHDTVWTFRHIYRGQPKRHLLTTGWSLFVNGKRLFAGDSVLFIRDDKGQLLLGIRRANRQPTNLSSSVLSSDSMHIGVLAAAAHAAANNSPFSVFYNPRASPSEFVIPLAKYYKAVYGQQISLGMRFRMLFETEESGTRRYMGTITGISDLDPARWKNSHWRNLQVGWDESTAGERRNRVSVWEIEPVTAPFFMCPPPFLRAKRPRLPGMPDDDSSDLDSPFKRTFPWLGDDIYAKDPRALSGLSLMHMINMQQNSSSVQTNYLQSLSGSPLRNLSAAELSHQLGMTPPNTTQQNNLQFNVQRSVQPVQQLDQLQKSTTANQSVVQPQQHLPDTAQLAKQNSINQSLLASQLQSQSLQSQPLMQNHNIQHSASLQNNQFLRNLSPIMPQQHQQQQMLGQNPPQTALPQQVHVLVNQQSLVSGNQTQMQLLPEVQQQPQIPLTQQATFQMPTYPMHLQDHQSSTVNVSQSIHKPVTPSQELDMPQLQNNSYSQSHHISQQLARNCRQTETQVPQSPQLPKSQQRPAVITDIQGSVGFISNPVQNQPFTTGSSKLTRAAVGMQPAFTDEIPSCFTSPSTNNCSSLDPTVLDRNPHRNTFGEGIPQVSAAFCSDGLETMAINANLVKDVHHKSDIKPSVNISKSQNPGSFAPHTYQTVTSTQMDYLDTSSATSVSLTHNDVQLTHNPLSFNSQSVLLRNACPDVEVQGDPKNNVPVGTKIDGQMGTSRVSESVLTKNMAAAGKDLSNNYSSGDLLASYDNSKDAQQELSSSMVTQSFGVPDMAFTSIDSGITDGDLLNRGAWAPPPQYQRMRTYTKVYKRGAVGRSIDVTRYSGYEELKQDLARRFGIEGQLEDRGRVGWKLVYVDHENDVLLVGDDPWEEFVRCVRCIKILSPQEVQQMSLDGDFGNPLQNQACSSSDGGNI